MGLASSDLSVFRGAHLRGGRRGVSGSRSIRHFQKIWFVDLLGTGISNLVSGLALDVVENALQIEQLDPLFLPRFFVQADAANVAGTLKLIQLGP